MAVIDLKKFKIRTSPDSNALNTLRVGDIVRRQYFDGKNGIYTLMYVFDTGVDKILDDEGVEKESLYFKGYLLYGDEPKSGELLDFVRVTNLTDPNRSGALYLTSSDDESPYMDVVDGFADEHAEYAPVGVGDGGYQSIEDGTIVGYKKSTNKDRRVATFTNNGSVGKLGMSHSDSDTINDGVWLVSFRASSSKPTEAKLHISSKSSVDADHTVHLSETHKEFFFPVTSKDMDVFGRDIKLYSSSLTEKDDFITVSDFVIVKLSILNTLSGVTKTRVGKLDGIIDPSFGKLEGHGAYFQRLYVTKDANISGTIVAGDIDGCGSTFYAGRIHKNTLVNSLGINFLNNAGKIVDELSPTGIGNVYTVDSTSADILVQSKEWSDKNYGKQVCFSIYIKASKDEDINLISNQGESLIQRVFAADGWTRLSFDFVILESGEIVVSIPNKGVLFSSPQMEYGKQPTPYQPTDQTLDYTNEYGAWMSRGGIGGTIQNPLLKLNEDGSVESKGDGFKINNDGSGYLGGGAIQFSGDRVEISFGDTNIGAGVGEIVDNKIDDIEIGGRNRFLNTSKMNHSEGWMNYTYWYMTDDMFMGNSVMSNVGIWGGLTQKVYVTKGERYVFSVYARKNIENATGFIYVGGGIPEVSGDFLERREVSILKRYPSNLSSSQTGDWTRMCMVFEPKRSGDMYIRLESQSGGRGTISVSSIKFEQGGKPTDWTPSPEDLDSELLQLETNFEIKEGQIASSVKEVRAIGEKVDQQHTEVTQTSQSVKVQAEQVKKDAQSVSENRTSVELTAKGVKSQAGQVKKDADKVSSDRTSVEQTAEKIASTATQVSKDAQSVSANKTSVEQTAQSIKSTAEKVASDAKSVSNSKTSIEQTASSVKSLATEVQTNAKEVSTKHSEVSQKAGEVTILAKQTKDSADRSEKAEVSINLKADGIVLEASNKAAERAIDELDIGGRNYLTNSSIGRFQFVTNNAKDHPTIFEASSSGDYFIARTTNKSNVHAYSTRSFDSISPLLMEQYNEGKSICMSIEVRTKVDATIRMFPSRMRFNIKANKWTRIWSVFNPNFQTREYIYALSIDNDVDYVEYRKYKVEIGSKPTDWTPAPEDIASREEIESSFEMTPNSISLMSKKINMSGMVTFQSLASGSGSNTIIDGGKIKTNLLDVKRIVADGIEAKDVNSLTLTTTKGKIGGWNINSSSISSNNILISSVGTIQRLNKWSFFADGAGYIASKNIEWNAAGDITFSDKVQMQWADSIEVGGRNFFSYRRVGIWSSTGKITSNNNLDSITYIAGPSQVVAIQGHDYFYGTVCVSGRITINGKPITQSDMINSNINTGETPRTSIVVKEDGYFYGTYTTSKTPSWVVHTGLRQSQGDIVVVEGLMVELSNTPSKWSPNPYDKVELGDLGGTVISNNKIKTSLLEVTDIVAQGIRAEHIKADFITGKSLTFTRGKIGGWTIGSTKLTGNNIELDSSGGIKNTTGTWALNPNGDAHFGKNKEFAVTYSANARSAKVTIAGFEVAGGRIGVQDESNPNEFGNLIITKDLIRIGAQNSYVLLGDDVMGSISPARASIQVTNKTRSIIPGDRNVGINVNVSSGDRNFGVVSNAPMVSPAMISNSVGYITITASGYNIDFSQYSNFIVTTTADSKVSINLPSASSVKEMFGLGYSEVVLDMGFVFSMTYDGSGGGITINGVRDHKGSLKNMYISGRNSIWILCQITNRGNSVEYIMVSNNY